MGTPATTVKLGDEANGFHQDGFVPVALASRVPVKASLENGRIQPGDKLTASSVPGIAMKATKPGQIVGTALESLDSISSGSYSRVMVFVNVGYWAPSVDSILASASSSTPLSLLNDSSFIDQLFSLIIEKFQSIMNIAFHNGLIQTVKGIFQTVEVQYGITTYDRTTDQPYCISVDNGQTIATPGACDTGSPTPSPSITPTLSVTPSETPSMSPTPTPSPSDTPTPTP